MVSVQSEYIMSADVSDEIQKPNRDDPFLLNIKKIFFFLCKNENLIIYLSDQDSRK